MLSESSTGSPPAPGFRLWALGLVRYHAAPGQSRGPRASDQFFERQPFHQFHHERGNALALLQTEDLRDVWMIERGEDFGLALEPGEPIPVSSR